MFPHFLFRRNLENQLDEKLFESDIPTWLNLLLIALILGLGLGLLFFLE